jgi:hypothetical protein
MATLATLSIDLSKVNKEKLYKGQYLNLTISLNDETSQYGKNVSAYEEQSKEEREAKEKKNYVGNGKIVWTDGKVTLAEKEAPKKEDTNLPF